METRRSKRIKLRNESRSSGDVDVQGKGLDQKPKSDLSDVNANYELRVTREHQVIHGVGLPMICWEQGIITAHLEEDDPDCLENLINSSPYFREVFKDKRISFLSEKVWRIFSTWLIAEDNTNTWLNTKCLAGYRPNAFFLRKSLLNCRLACKSWCSSVDKWIQHQLLNGVPARESPDLFGLPLDELTVNKFFQHFENTHPPLSTSRSPLVTRRLIFRDNWRRDDMTEEFWNRIRSILQNYGDHIWHLDFGICCNQEAGLSPHRTYLLFREMLMLTPNLKTLYIYYDDRSRANQFIYDEAFIRSYPLPKLPSLKFLRIGKVPRDIFSHILSQNDHVTGFELSFKGYYNFDVELGNLTKFKIVVMHGGSNFRILGAAIWPVKKLHLDFFASQFIWHEQIFKMISDKWGKHCEEMRLILPNNNPGRSTIQMCLNCRFNLPKVKVLVLEMNGNIISMDVFLRMKSLERITISRQVDPKWVWDLCLDENPSRSGTQSRIIQFTGFEKKMYQSNIWNMLPKLKYLKVDRMEYRRAELIEKCKKKTVYCMETSLLNE